MELHLSDRSITALNFLLVVVLSYFAALSVNDVVTLRRGSAEAPVLRTRGGGVNDASARRSRAAYQAIVDRDIFNLVPPPVAAPEVQVEELHITLIGVTQSTGGKPYAIFADRNGEQSVYQVGETIPDSGKLLEVDKDRAIIEHGGKPVTLELPKDDMSGDGSGNGGLSPSEGAANRDALRHRLMRHRNRD